MLDALAATFKAGFGTKGVIGTIQHVESFGVNVLDAFTGDAVGRNAAIDCACSMLQSMKVVVPPAPPAA